MDIIYHICRWDLSVYRAVIFNRKFHEYMRTRILQLQKDHTVIEMFTHYTTYTICGRLHRVDGPAVIWHIGRVGWYLNGHLHRVGGPAVTLADGTEIWAEDGYYLP